MPEPRCQVCAGPLSPPLLDLGYQPLCNALITEPGVPQTFYPLAVHRCAPCNLVQLGHVLPTATLFGDQFTYLTGSSPGAVAYFDTLAGRLVERFNLKPGDSVVDVGSGDGTFLKGFQNRGMRVLGIEGARRPAEAAIGAGVETICRFLNAGAVDRVRKRHGTRPIKLITAMNVLAHCDDVNEVVGQLRAMMTPDTALVVQNHWLPALLEQGAFDTIYHEHLRYFSLDSLNLLLARHGIFVYDAEVVDYYGGSLLVCADTQERASLLGAQAVGAREHDDLGDEFFLHGRFDGLVDQMVDNKLRLQNILGIAYSGRETVIGIGAPMKATTLLNYFGVTKELMACVTETNPLKWGHAIPGVGIPIVDEASVDLSTVDYAVILAWNWADRLMEKYRGMGYRGKFIVPHPTVRAVD